MHKHFAFQTEDRDCILSTFKCKLDVIITCFPKDGTYTTNNLGPRRVHARQAAKLKSMP